MTRSLVIWSLFVFAACASGQRIPKGAVLPKDTLSPNRHYGVLVPLADLAPNAKVEVNSDSLFDLKTGRVLTELPGDTGYDHPLNWLSVAPTRWSRDGSLIVWEVSHKWCPGALDAVKIDQDKVLWKLDILQAAQRAILIRTKQAAARRYAAAVKANATQADGYRGERTDYPEGFTIDVDIPASVTLPLRVEAVLTSNVKNYEVDNRGVLNAQLEGSVDAQGKFTVTGFRLGKRKWDRF